MQVKLLAITPNSEKHIEYCGRCCYQSTEKITEDSYKNFILNLINSGHLSVLEHASATVLISGITRACSHQLVRHRLFTYSQKSQRYVKESNFDFVEPDTIKNKPESHKMFQDQMKNLSTVYKWLIDDRIKAEDARAVLPNACTTEIVMTGNFRNWRHFFDERLHKSAQHEIRTLANLILFVLHQEAPVVFQNYIKP
jgi:thymidylate synthase (FAD)